jgi:tetratricopeptide (TPR) repeat protein
VTDQQRFDEALLLKGQKRYAEAQRLLEQLALSEQTSAALYAVLGDVYWEQGLMDKAIEAFRTSTSLSPKSEAASLGLFHCLWEKGDQNAAISEARRFLSVVDSEEYRKTLQNLEAADTNSGPSPGST